MQSRGNALVLQAQYGLDESGDPSGRLQVANVAFRGADVKPVLRRASGAENAGKSVRLDGIAERGSSPVRLNVLHLGRLDTRRFESFAYRSEEHTSELQSPV